MLCCCFDFCSKFLLYRRITNKILQWTVTEKISKKGDECIVDKDYSPDRSMMTILTSRVGCNLPWSSVRIPGFEACTHFEHEQYLTEAVELQNEISKIPNKCSYNSWNALPFEEETVSSETNSTFLYAALFSDSGKVSKNTYIY